MVDIDGIKLAPEPSEQRLGDRQILDYKDHRRKLIEWLLVFGKGPDMVEGYAEATVRNTAARLDKFYRWVWNDKKEYTTEITHSHANDYNRSR